MKFESVSLALCALSNYLDQMQIDDWKFCTWQAENWPMLASEAFEEDEIQGKSCKTLLICYMTVTCFRCYINFRERMVNCIGKQQFESFALSVS